MYRSYTQRFDVVSLRGIMANVEDWDIIGREFELQSCYYVHFRTRKGLDPVVLPAMG